MVRPRSSREESLDQPPRLESSGEADLRQSLEFERVVGRVARSLAAAEPDEIDDAVTSGLRELALDLQFDRAFLGRLQEGNIVVTHYWLEPGLQEEQKSFHRLVNAEEFTLVTKSLAGETIAIRSPDEVAASMAERQYMEQCGMEATIFVPGTIGDEVVGVLVLDRFGKLFQWSDSLIERLSVPVDLLFHALLGAEQRTELEDRADFEALMADLGASLAAAVGQEDIDRGIEVGLQRLAQFLDSDLAFVALISADGSRLEFSHGWFADVAQQDLSPQAYTLEEVPWLMEHLEQGEPLVGSPGLPGLPDDARRDLEASGMKTGVVIPIRIGSRPLGVLSIQDHRKAREYPLEVMSRLQTAASVIGSTIDRVRSEKDLHETLIQVEQLKSRFEDENVYLRREIRQHTGQHRIVGESAAVLEMLEAAGQVAKTDSTVLILGETGTGKELVAQEIHAMSARWDRTLVRINCGALPPTLIESELFGREKGAYTGALTRQKGRFEIADGSTILLDEIAELPVELQPKLLQVLERGSFERLGSPKTLQVDVRVIAATNRDLQKAVEEGSFREDLFFRLNVFPIRVAPLRERPGDIPLLAWSFVRELSDKMGKAIEAIPQESMAALQRYSWPGNVRELRNAVERAMIRNHGPVLEIEIPKEPTRKGAGTLEDLQRHHIIESLQAAGWRVRGAGGAAELLGLKPTTLDYRMKKLGIRRPAKTSSNS